MNNKTFPTGLFCKRRDNAPDFVLCDVSIKAADFYEFLRAHKNDAGYVNLQILKSRDGNPYAVLNDWKPETQESQETENNSFRPAKTEDTKEKDAPFQMFDPKEEIPF